MRAKTQTTSLSKFVLYGINSVIGLTFLVGIGGAFRHSGNWIFLCALLGAVIAFTIGTAYAWLSKHLSTAKSSVYTYAKLAFGYKTAYFLNWIQYVTTPALLVAEMLQVVLGFSALSFYKEFLWLIILVSILLFVGLTALLIFFINTTKLIVYTLMVISVLSMAFFVGSGFVNKSFFSNLVSSPSSSVSSVSFQGVITSFFTFFFAIGGIEYLVSSSDELNNRESNAFKGILIVVALSLFAHVLFLAIEKGGVGANVLATTSSGFGKGPVNIFWITVYGSAIGTVIIYVYIVINVIAESAARIVNGWLAARIIEPMAEDGFFPHSWASRSRTNQLRIALFWQGVITLVLLLGLVVPLLFYPNASQTLSAPFQIYSMIVFIQYAGVTASLLVLMHRKKIPFYKFMFPVYYILLAVFIVLEVLYIYSALTLAIGNKTTPGDESQWIALISSFICIGLAVPCYYIGKWTKSHERHWRSAADPRLLPT